MMRNIAQVDFIIYSSEFKWVAIDCNYVFFLFLSDTLFQFQTEPSQVISNKGGNIRENIFSIFHLFLPRNLN